MDFDMGNAFDLQFCLPDLQSIRHEAPDQSGRHSVVPFDEIAVIAIIVSTSFAIVSQVRDGFPPEKSDFLN